MSTNPTELALHDAANRVGDAAIYHSRKAAQCQALAALLRAIDTDIEPQPLPVELLAQALLPLNLCIVHREIVRQAADIVGGTEDADGLSQAELNTVLGRLEQAYNGHKD